jgi:hypothetical protein
MEWARTIRLGGIDGVITYLLLVLSRLHSFFL